MLMYVFFAFLFNPDWVMRIELRLSFLTWSCITSPAHFSGIIARRGILTYTPARSHMTEVCQLRTGLPVPVISPSVMCAVLSLTQCAFNYFNSFIILDISPDSLMTVR